MVNKSAASVEFFKRESASTLLADAPPGVAGSVNDVIHSPEAVRTSSRGGSKPRVPSLVEEGVEDEVAHEGSTWWVSCWACVAHCLPWCANFHGEEEEYAVLPPENISQGTASARRNPESSAPMPTATPGMTRQGTGGGDSRVSRTTHVEKTPPIAVPPPPNVSTAERPLSPLRMRLTPLAAPGSSSGLRLPTSAALRVNEDNISAGAEASHTFDDVLRNRKPFDSVSAVQRYLDRYNHLLPVQLRVENDVRCTFTPSLTAAVQPMTLSICGPLRPSRHASLLSVLEDVLLEDCEMDFPITALYCEDLHFEDEGETTPPTPRSNHEWLSEYLSSSEVLNLPDLTEATMQQQRIVSFRESARRVFILLSNVLEACAHLEAAHYCRVSCLPREVRTLCGTTPGAFCRETLRRLVFDRCPLTPSHIDLLVQGMREGCFAALMELQVSGSLTDHCVTKILSSYEEAGWGGNLAVPLRILRVPTFLVSAARRHPFAAANPQLRIEALQC